MHVSVVVRLNKAPLISQANAWQHSTLFWLLKQLLDADANAWYSSSGSEIGDRCASQFQSCVNLTTSSWQLQTEWSNANSGYIQQEGPNAGVYAARLCPSAVTTYLESSESQVMVTGWPTVTLMLNGISEPLAVGVHTIRSPMGRNSSGKNWPADFTSQPRLSRALCQMGQPSTI